MNFNAVASDLDGDALGFSWDFGDGQAGSGGTLSHTYAAPSVYTVTLMASDGHGGSASDMVTITVAAPQQPAIPQGPPPIQTQPFASLQLKGKANLKRSGRDCLTLVAGLDALPGFNPDGQTIVVDAGGAALEAQLNARGKGKAVAGAVQLKPARGAPKSDPYSLAPVSLRVMFKKGSWADDWGFAAGGAGHPLLVTVSIGGKTFQVTATLRTRLSPGRSASFTAE